MKKILAALIAAFMISAGLVAAAGSPAQAACPYTGCVKTTTVSNAKQIKKTRKVAVAFKVTAQGNAKPKGKVKVTLKGKGRNLVKSASAPNGRVVFKGVKPGTYKVLVKYGANGAFKASADRTTVKVRRR